MSHALLLRLFLSPSFFSVHVALRYLMLYADNIGITYYLTRRLREYDTHELREVWGFICHLLITRPSKSRALECFVVDISRKSTHIAMLTLWFMQSSLQDLSSSPNTPSFKVCQRTLHQCHEIIFGDLPTPNSGPYSGMSITFSPFSSRKKVKPLSEPALVGIALVLAGAPAMPRLTSVMGEVAIEQGRAEDESSKSLKAEDDGSVGGSLSPRKETADDDLDDDDDENSDDGSENKTEKSMAEDHTHHSTADTPKRRKTIAAAQTSPALVLLRNVHPPRMSDDPLGQNDRSDAPYQSTPSISHTRQPLRPSQINAADALLRQYDLPAQSYLLRSQYCRSEVQFLLTLENISNRLLVVPKPARVSALRAELTALNHKLPAEVCMPMWCSSSDTPRPPGTQPHHKIVRIPPGESVVLNSAERAPYLLLIEILNDDLDFDPTKRSNKEVLKRIVAKESQKKGASKDLINFTAPPLVSQRSLSGGKSTAEAILDAENNDVPEIQVESTAPNSQTSLDDEEMDLVDQVIGVGESLRKPIDLSESIVLPPAPKNKELDMAAWSRTPSMPVTPRLEQMATFSQTTPELRSNRGWRFDTPSTTPVITESGADISEQILLSLDEYSERMRTAAVMLAQLNASLVREPVTSLQLSGSPSLATPVSESPSTSISRSWIPGSSLFGSSGDTSTNGPIHPSLGGRGADASAPMRMRVQHAEAAAIRDRIMKEMMSLEEERMSRMKEHREGEGLMRIGDLRGSMKTAEDEDIVKRELNRDDPSAVVFSESWAAKKSRVRHGSPYGHLANWDCVSVIVKTGADLRQEQLAVQLIQEFDNIWREENCQCWVRYFRILITGASSGLVETITDAVSIHSIKKAEYARRLAEGRFGYVTLLDHFKTAYGDANSAKFVRAQRNFAKSMAGYSVITYLLQIKDRHNGNILLDREGHVVHIDFGFMLSNSPGNIGFEAAPFKLPPEYVEVLGGIDGEPFAEFKRLFREGFEAARKHCDRIITLVELMQKDSSMPCFAAFGEQTANQLRDRFQPALTHSLVGEHVDRLIDSSLGSNWTRLYDSYQYYSQSIL
ncbi:kinase-like protein [Coniophora puteana RWD-64-598 SS2]|uniref:1-phosphatidylinositol 4-kinase n=1 Tax=Coniophora puteana (strain RWD-64-598) TaxID=741705 RepID=A0A5M3N192_CONPW|nr:kinase-like protein [Coniophora puteana RWD-64-598 SS2]EIW85170.1 kinase-like protein [Coniophora puteana RWD-64-598 SS2]